MARHLNPLEKAFLIKQYKSNLTVKLNDFCDKNSGKRFAEDTECIIYKMEVYMNDTAVGASDFLTN